METNTKYIQIRGKLETDKTYTFGEDIRVLVTVTGIEEKDLDDGTKDVIYKAKMFEVLDEDS